MANATDVNYSYAAERSLGKQTVALKSPKPAQTLGSFIHAIIRKQDGYMYREKKDGSTGTYIDMAQLRTRSSVASRLGIKEPMLRKKLYHYDTSREWIIAISAAYGLNAKQTSGALNLYNHGGLDLESDREELIENWLDAYAEQGKLLSLEELDNMLVEQGMAPINIQKRSKADKPSDDGQGPKYEIKSNIVVEVFGLDGDPYNSLETEYLPTSRCIAYALISAQDGTLYELEVDQDGKAGVKTKGDVIPKEIPVDHPDFGRFIPTLLAEAKKKKQWHDDVVRESKNYRGRFSANLKENSIHVFYEEFNYGAPERNEYFLMEYWHGQYSLSIAHQSMFMQEYLTADNYYEHYHTRDRIRRKSYSSLEEIEALLKSEKKLSWDDKDLIKSRAYTFKLLKEEVQKRLEQIRNRQIFIRSAKDIWDNPYDVLWYFKLEELFEAKREDEYNEICEAKESVVVDAGTDHAVEITFDDLIAAFEFGFHDFEQICQVKREHGTVEAVLT